MMGKKYGCQSADVYILIFFSSVLCTKYIRKDILLIMSKRKCFLLFVVQNYDVAFTLKYK